MSNGFHPIDPDEIPKHFDAAAAGETYAARWDALAIHRYDPTRPREETFVVDTPPPTVSGSLHIGHVFSYTHTDVIVRQRRMAGKNIFYPMGWDDNGLPTERRVQNHFHVRCDPSLAYAPDLSLAPATAATRKQPPRLVSRPNFIELCSTLTAEDEVAFKALWRRLGLSVDWAQEYSTIGPHCRRIAQASFLDLYAKGWLYSSDAPSLWDVDFQTAVAQAELEDREQDSTFNDIAFGIEGTTEEFLHAGLPAEVVIATTRPELLPACVAVATHPDDTRYRSLVGRRAVTPLFHVPVPILASERVDPEKGTGILMICTFGDQTDVQWWREHGLPLRQVLARNGRLRPVTFGSAGWDSRAPEAANRAYAELQGKRPEQARARILELLEDASASANGSGEAPLRHKRPIRHAVKFFEKGDRPLELIPTRQWFCRLLDKKARLLAQGAKVHWHPELMGQRFSTWTENLQFDWGISRQRYFGVPFPVWYRLDEHGEPDYDAPLLAEPERLPVDPTVDVPTGFEDAARGRPGGFVAESDVFDTWFTSSLSPQISSHWGLDEDRHARLFPADMRPQAHEIIRTWAFYTIVKALAHEDAIPWRNVVISGWVVQRNEESGKAEKISKSKEKKRSIPPPHELIDTYTADAVRYWAASARLGVDTAFDENTLAQGKRLVTKIWNASKFVLSQAEPREPENDDGGAHTRWKAEHARGLLGPFSNELDLAFLHELRATVESATRSFESFEFAPALKATETFFWTFTDHYLELVKGRARAESPDEWPGRFSAVASLRLTLELLLKLFAPVLPYVTDEVWSWVFADRSGHPSIHRAPWPNAGAFTDVPAPEDPRSFAIAAAALGAIHRAKTSAGVGVGRTIERVTIVGQPEDLARLQHVLPDVTQAGRVEQLTLREDPSASEGAFTVEDIAFAPKPAKE